MTLVVRRRKHIQDLLAIFLVGELPQKRGELVHDDDDDDDDDCFYYHKKWFSTLD